MVKFIPIGVAAFFLGMFVITMTVFVVMFSSDDDGQGGGKMDISEGGGTPISDDVSRYKDDFEKYAKENNIEDQVDVLMALTMQESGGGAQDVMQSSESQGDSPNTIASPQKSIKVGVSYYADLYKETNGKTKLTLQAYNMGGGFIDYAEKHNDGNYSHKLAQKFSDKKKDENGSSVYGDPNYVQHVQRYLGDDGSEKHYEGGKWIAPVEHDITITSGYGKRHDPFTGGTGGFHSGIDFACSSPEKVQAVHDGRIYKTGFNAGGWGNYVVIQNGDNELSLVGHLGEIKAHKGSDVHQGETVGVCGQTGSATGEHVHLEYWDSTKALADSSHRKNPKQMLRGKGDDD